MNSLTPAMVAMVERRAIYWRDRVPGRPARGELEAHFIAAVQTAALPATEPHRTKTATDAVNRAAVNLIRNRVADGVPTLRTLRTLRTFAQVQPTHFTVPVQPMQKPDPPTPVRSDPPTPVPPPTQSPTVTLATNPVAMPTPPLVTLTTPPMPPTPPRPQRLPPPRPVPPATTARPGTMDKLRLVAERLKAGLQPFHPVDAA